VLGTAMTPLQENHITTQTRDGQKQAFVADVAVLLEQRRGK